MTTPDSDDTPIVEGNITGFPIAGAKLNLKRCGSCCEGNVTTLNIVKDYQLLEQHYGPGTIGLRRSVDVKRVSIENSTPFRIGIGFSTQRYGQPPCFDPPPIYFYLEPGNTRWIGANPPGDLQFIWVFTEEGVPANTPHPIDYYNNQFVVRTGNYECGNTNIYDSQQGESWNPWFWISDYRQPSI